MVISDNLGLEDIEDLGKHKGHHANQVNLDVNMKHHRKAHKRTAFQKEESYWTPENRARFGHRAGNPATIVAYGEPSILAPVGGDAPMVEFPSDTIDGLGYLGKKKKSLPAAAAALLAPAPPPPPAPGLPPDMMNPGSQNGQGLFPVEEGGLSTMAKVSIGVVSLLAIGAVAYFLLRKKPGAPASRA